jgi:hypothetical protein
MTQLTQVKVLSHTTLANLLFEVEPAELAPRDSSLLLTLPRKSESKLIFAGSF